MALQPNDSIGPYVLIRQLGRGAFGEVWLGRHHHLGEELAIKVPTDAGYVRQLRTEAQIQWRLNHPNIVRTVDLMPIHDPPYYVMEYVAGVNLRQKLQGAGKLPLAEARPILRQILVALEHAHAAGICHRDLKPENILCQPDGVVKVTDFGFGKVQAALAQSMIFSGSLASASGSITGTVQYMSPQQQAGEEPDPKDDLYAVGVVACELLTGSRPQPMGVTKMLERAGADVAFAAVLEKAMEHDRKDRYASAPEMRDALERFGARTAITSQSVQSPRPAVSISPPLPLPASRSQVPKQQSRQPSVRVRSLRRESKPDLDEVARRLQAVTDTGAEAAPPPAVIVPPIQQSNAPPTVGTHPSDYSCAQCGRTIAPHEQPYLRDGAVICPTCCGAPLSLLPSPLAARAFAAPPAVPRVFASLDPPVRSQWRPQVSRVGDTWVNGIGMEFAYIPAGESLMGSPAEEIGRYPNETQLHVKVAEPFMMATTPLTQAQWKAVMRDNPSFFKGDDLPVDTVSWNDAVAFREKLREQEGKNYRLPTEAEWEYACRAGTNTAYYNGDGEPELNDAGWFDSNSGGTTHSVRTRGETGWGKGWFDSDNGGTTHGVGQKKPNDWGLYDMHGNVLEWCNDYYGGGYPAGPAHGSPRLLRGGSWYSHPECCRAAYRIRDSPDTRSRLNGFRLCLHF